MYGFIAEKIGKLEAFWAHQKWMRKQDLLEHPLRQDIQVWRLPGHADLAVYWKDFAGGTGCTCLVRCQKREMVKYDFLLKGHSHYHLFPNLAEKKDFPVENVHDQFVWALDRIQEHYRISVQQHPRPNRRSGQIDLPEHLVQRIHDKLVGFMEQRPWERDHSG